MTKIKISALIKIDVNEIIFVTDIINPYKLYFYVYRKDKTFSLYY